MTRINKQTYYLVPRWFILASVTISRANSTKYKLTKAEEVKEYYFLLSKGPMTLKVPFRALFEVNNKIKPIVSLSFSSAIFCPSARLGLCQLANNNTTCYAKNGQRRANGTYSKNGTPKLNSLGHSYLVIECLEQLKENKELLALFCKYLDEKVPVLRYNLKGDFKDSSDIELLNKLVLGTSKTIFYGYSARDDLGANLKKLCKAPRLWLNGSNQIYTNRFKATYDLENWLNSNKICLGGCNKCKKCYTLKGQTILCLVHGKNQYKDLNTWNNRLFLSNLFNKLTGATAPKLQPKDLELKSGLLDSLNHQLTNKLGLNLEFKDYWDLRAWYTKSQANDSKALGVA